MTRTEYAAARMTEFFDAGDPRAALTQFVCGLDQREMKELRRAVRDRGTS